MRHKSFTLKATIKDQSGAGKIKIGEILSKEGQITSIQLEEALSIQKETNERLSSILLSKGYIDSNTIVNVLGRLYNYNVFKFSDIKPDPKALKSLPYKIAKTAMAFPLESDGEVLSVTMVEPTDTDVVEHLREKTRKTLKVNVSTKNDIIKAYRKFYKISDKEYKSFSDFEDDPEYDEPGILVDDFGSLVSRAAKEVAIRSSDKDDAIDEFMASDAPIIKLVNGILDKAIIAGVSDIHLEPFERTFQVRYRLDGSMYKAMNLPGSIKNAVIARIKILAQLDIAERRVPQDGRIKLKFRKKKAIDFRVSTLPTLFGESIVIRILDKSALNIDLTKLGFEPAVFSKLTRCISRAYGLLLVTGPTGSGKTTTLYSILNRLNKDDIKILTVEDPVEFNFKGINQVSVKEEIGMSFAAALKAFLRQDPDIIMVGEIRDLETAQIAIKAAMTGHLVFATIHTNDCPSTITRLVDIGIPPYMLASSITMVLSQRLVRRLCPECKNLVTNHDPKELEFYGFLQDEIKDLKIYRSQGCRHCNRTGYKGRAGLYELMEITDDVSKAISAKVPEDHLRKIAIQEGMITLRDAGLEKIRTKTTCVEEIVRKTTLTRESLPAYFVNPDVERYDNNDVIIREGNTDIDFFKLVQGELYVAAGGKKIAQIVEPGDFFGEMSAITGEPRSASIISKGRSTIKRFPGNKLMELIEKHPDIAKHLFKVLSMRLNSTNKRLVNALKRIGN